MAELLQLLGRALDTSPGLAVAAAVVWGALSVLLSPCHLAGVPLVVAYMGGAAELPGFRRALAIASVFAAANLVSIAAVGALTAAAGRMLGDVGPAGDYALAAVFVLVGLDLLGVLPGPRWGVPSAAAARRGLAGALALGLVFGAAVGPCTFAFLAPVLGVGLKAGARHPGHAAALVALFGVGHAAVLAVAGASGGAVQRYVRWAAGARGPVVVRGAAGVLVVAAGVYFLFTARGAS